jgi:glucose-1-phosphate thymidylyltransferase
LTRLAFPPGYGPGVKALVLAGGSGTRLRPITYTSAKQLVPLANKPILFFGLESIAASGVRDVGIVVGDTHEAIHEAVGDGSRFGLDVTYIRQPAPLGIAHGVLIARDFLGDDPFVLYLGDNLIVGGIEPFVAAFERDRPNALVLLAAVDHPEQFGVAELDADGNLVRLVEKPSHPSGNLALVGVYLFDAHVHDAVRAIRPSGRGELEITDAIQWLVGEGLRVRAQRLTTQFIDTGKLQDLLEANRIVLESVERDVAGSVDDESQVVGRVVVAPGARIARSTVQGPAVIGPGARIERSVVGPFTSLGAWCEVLDSEIEHSVVLEGARIEGVRRIADSLLGRGSVVCRTEEQPRAYRLHVGDHSEVEVT